MTAGSLARSPVWLAIALGLASGSLSAAVVSPRLGAKQAIILTDQSRGAVVTKVGTPIEIRLQAQSGTGFSWAPKQWAALVTPMPPLRGNRAMPGGTQIQRFRFLAKRAGTYPVSFSYDQPWRGGTKGARTKTFTIIVR